MNTVEDMNITKSYRIMTGIILIYFLTGFASAQEELSFTIKEAQNYALENNYDVRNARLNIKAAQKQRMEVTAAGFPQIEASADYQKLIDIPTQLIPGEFFGEDAGTTVPVKFGQTHNITYGISVSQLIFSGSYLVGLRASKIYQKLSVQGARSTELDVQETIAQTYYLIIIGEESRRILQESLDNLKKTLYEISAMYDEGFVEETDVKQLQISVAGLENSIVSIDQQIMIAYDLLKMQMGIPFSTPIRLKDDLAKVFSDLDIRSRLEREFDLNNNITYKLLTTQEQLADLTLKNELTGFMPTIAAFGSIQRNAQRNEFNFFDSDDPWFRTTVVGLSASWPIFSGGQRVFKVQKAKIELQQASLQRQKAEQGLDLEFRQTRSDLSTTFKRYQNSENNMKLSKEIYDINLIKYKEGLISSLDLIQSHTQFLQAESEYMTTTSDLLNAQNKMDKLLENY